MPVTLKKAHRSLARLKIAIGGPAGSGKTMSSLLMAYGMVKAEHPDWPDDQVWESICLIDTENASGSLYAGNTVGNLKIGSYFTVDIEPPFEATKYIDAIHAAEDAGISVIIIDSYSHAWAGEGGALDKQSKLAERGNGYTAWGKVKPEQQKLLDTVLQSKSHIIACLRAKMEYSQDVDPSTGKKVVRPIGMGVISQKDIEYEYTVLFMLAADNTAEAIKDRTSLFAGHMPAVITPKYGAALYRWLIDDGKNQAAKAVAEKPALTPAPEVAATVAAQTAEAEPAPVADEEPLPFTEIPPEEPSVTVQDVDQVIRAYVAAHPTEKSKVAARIKAIAGISNYLKVEDPEALAKIYNEFKE